jgi:diadenosine tetraphosphate (Ap4A) HIT family hydrolase
MEFERLLIKEYDYWKIYLHENQCYLGRCYIWAKRHDALDFFDMTQEEFREYTRTGNHLKAALKDLFNPDLLNYATFANEVRHLHTHVIPRYKSPRKFEGVNFSDKNWGKNYAPYDRDFIISEEVLVKIKNAVKGMMED